MIPLCEVIAKTLGAKIFNGTSVLDVGCARFAQSIAMRDMGAEVTAMDILKREEPPLNINFIQEDFLKWKPSQKFQLLHMSNSAMFMPTNTLFKKIKTLEPSIIAIRTMYDYPTPNWDTNELKTLYFTKSIDWASYFEPLGYQTVHALIYEEETPDLRGRLRLFRFTKYLGTKLTS